MGKKESLLGISDVFLAEIEKGLGSSGGTSSGLGVPFFVTQAEKPV